MPQMLPGNRAVLFTLATGTGADRMGQGAHRRRIALGSGERKTLVGGGSDARYVPTGRIVYALAGTLFAVPFDERRLEVTGGAAPIVEGVRRTTGNRGFAQFSISNTGSLVFIPGPASASLGQSDLALTDRGKGGVESLR